MNKTAYRKTERKIKKLLKVCNAMEHTTTATVACDKEHITFHDLLYFFRTVAERDFAEIPALRLGEWMSWTDKLLSEICGELCIAPSSFEHDVQTTLHDQRQFDALKYFYDKNYSYKEIGNNLQISENDAKLLIDEGICKLKKPWTRHCLRNGSANIPRNIDLHSEQGKCDQAYVEFQNRQSYEGRIR